MNKMLSLALALPLMACVVGSDAPTGTGTGGDSTGGTGGGTGSGGGDGTGGGGGSNSGGGTPMTGDITANTTWSGNVSVPKSIAVATGATLTIAAGTTVKFASGVAITINGKMDVQGVKGNVVTFAPATAGGFYSGFTVSTGGTLAMSYVAQTGGDILVNGGTATIVDSRMSNASGDLLVVNSGKVDMSYSAIGLEPNKGTDSTHCDMHFGGSGATISVTHSNISTSSYGLMLYGGNNVNLTYNNWFNNPIQIDTNAGVSGDISNGWFDKAVPTAGAGATLTFNNKAAVRLTDAGPRD